MDNSKVRILIKDLLENIGEDPKREGLLETPRRVADAYEFLTSGYNKDIEEVMNDAEDVKSIIHDWYQQKINGC